MKVTQKNIRVFHITIDDEALFLEYFRKNKPFAKGISFLLIEGTITKNIAFVLEQSGVCYKDINQCSIRFGGIKKESSVLDETSQKSPQNEEKSIASTLVQKLKLFDRPIRSGEEIIESVPIVIFGRVNSGAKVFSEESISIYGIIDGLVQCDGEYIVLNGISPRGHLIFNGEIVDRDTLKQNVLQKIVMRDNVIEIKEIV